MPGTSTLLLSQAALAPQSTTPARFTIMDMPTNLFAGVSGLAGCSSALHGAHVHRLRTLPFGARKLPCRVNLPQVSAAGKFCQLSEGWAFSLFCGFLCDSLWNLIAMSRPHVKFQRHFH